MGAGPFRKKKIELLPPVEKKAAKLNPTDLKLVRLSSPSLIGPLRCLKNIMYVPYS